MANRRQVATVYLFLVTFLSRLVHTAGEVPGNPNQANSRPAAAELTLTAVNFVLKIIVHHVKDAQLATIKLHFLIELRLEEVNEFSSMNFLFPLCGPSLHAWRSRKFNKD